MSVATGRRIKAYTAMAEEGTLEIRTARLEDAPELCDYAARLFAENLPGIFKRPTPTLEEEREFIGGYAGRENSTLLVAVEDGEIIGLLGVEGGTLDEERHAGTFGMSVATAHRGRGVGTALIEAMFRWAPTSGISRIQAWAWANNPGSIALYKRMGFAEEGVSRRAIISNGQPVDVVLLAKLFD